MPSEVSQKGVTSITATSPVTITPDPTVSSGNIGLNVSVDHAFTARQTVTIDDAATTGLAIPLILAHTTTGTAGDGMSVGLLQQLEDADGNLQTAGVVSSGWTNVSSKSAYIQFNANTNLIASSSMRFSGSGGLSVGNTIDPGAGIVSADTGFWIGVIAPTSGKILKSDGSKFTASIETYAAPGNSGNVMTSDGTNWTSAAPSATNAAHPFGAGVDGAGSNVTNGFLGYYTTEFTGTITGWSITAAGTNPTCTFDIWKIATGTSVPTASNTITGGSGNRPALSTGNALRSTNMTNWTVGFNQGDIFGFNLDTTANASWTSIIVETLAQ